jgi:hypothetical protein
MVSFTTRPLYPWGKSLRYPLDRRLGGPQSRSGRHGEVKILVYPGTLNSDPSLIQPEASRYTDWATAKLSLCLINYVSGREDVWRNEGIEAIPVTGRGGL